MADEGAIPAAGHGAAASPSAERQASPCAAGRRSTSPSMQGTSPARVSKKLLPIERLEVPQQPEPGNANVWIFSQDEFLQSPSLAQSKITPADDAAYRQKAAAFVQVCGKELGITQSTIATACVMMHRFYMRYSFEDANLYEIGTACLFLACKVNENVRKLKQIVVVAARIAANQILNPNDPSKLFHKWKNVIMYNEEVVLEALCFDLTFSLPYPHLLKYLDEMEGDVSQEFKMMAWCIVNDSLHTSLCVRYAPAFIAAAAIVFTGMLMGYDPKVKHTSWQSLVRVHETILLSICDELSDLYETLLKDAQTMQTLAALLRSDHEASKALKEAYMKEQAFHLTKADAASLPAARSPIDTVHTAVPPADAVEINQPADPLAQDRSVHNPSTRMGEGTGAMPTHKRKAEDDDEEGEISS